jgi:hypothetical protein
MANDCSDCASLRLALEAERHSHRKDNEYLLNQIANLKAAASLHDLKARADALIENLSWSGFEPDTAIIRDLLAYATTVSEERDALKARVTAMEWEQECPTTE